MLSYRVFILKNIAFICFFNILNERKINQLKEINRMKKKKKKNTTEFLFGSCCQYDPNNPNER